MLDWFKILKLVVFVQFLASWLLIIHRLWILPSSAENHNLCKSPSSQPNRNQFPVSLTSLHPGITFYLSVSDAAGKHGLHQTEQAGILSTTSTFMATTLVGGPAISEEPGTFVKSDLRKYL